MARVQKEKTTLTLKKPIKEAAKHYFESLGESLSDAVDDLLLEKLRSHGIDPFAPKSLPAASMGLTLAGIV